ncbi:hypothetical protein BC938DRAFT_473604, partial [Jimgerdemannia flammicorona]
MDQIVENEHRKERSIAGGIVDPEGDVLGLEKEKPIGGGFRPTKPNPVLLALYGHILHCARSYVPATGLTHLAVPHYERVLELPSAREVRRQQGALIEVGGEEDDVDDTDLKHEAAYNLSTIYVTSGSMGLAQMLLRKYCVI